LQAIGLTRIGELLHLPRADLALRYGSTLPELLDRLFGNAPEAVPRLQPPETPNLHLEFDQEVTATGALLFPLKRLLLQLEHMLCARQCGVQHLDLHLLHRETTTPLALERSHPGRRAEAWLELWALRLARVTLPAPVRGLRLLAGQRLPLTGNGAGLFDERSGLRNESELLSRMRARLGDAAILCLAPNLQPLPEQAQDAWSPVGASSPPAPAATTPAQRVVGAALWLQPLQPRPAPGTQEWLGRLEGGWWANNNDQRRDYALARDREGRTCWLFRDLRSGQWHRQGFWG
jgi:protein ImuB